MAAGILSLLEKPKKMEAMSEAALQFMSKKPIDHGLDQFGKAVKALLKGKSPEPSVPERLYKKEAFKAKKDAVLSRTPSSTYHGPSIDAPGRLGFLHPKIRVKVRRLAQRIRRLMA
jgi:hypothetical protein